MFYVSLKMRWLNFEIGIKEKMRISRIGIKTKHDRGQEELLSHEILCQTSQLKRYVAGVYGFGNFLVRARNKIVDVIRKKLEKYECAEVSLPVLQPKKIWEESGRWEVFTKESLMFNFKGRNTEYCLAPTGEEAVLDFARQNIISYKDLPINIFQIGNKYRDEIRVRGGILRSKEFLMKDGYSFHADFEDMAREYLEMRKCYFEIFEELGMQVVAVKALNSDMGGKVSEEFMCFSRIGEDRILVDREKQIFLNEEVLGDVEILKRLEKENPGLKVESLEIVDCIELAHIFQLGQFYSQKMNGLFVDVDGSKKAYFMGCYGIGINRVLGTICENCCDEEGLVWPKSIAPYVAVIIYTNENEKEAQMLYRFLQENGLEVVLYDREATFGSKIKDSKLLGFLYMIMLGNKYRDEFLIEVEDRSSSQKVFLKKEELISFLNK